MKTSFIKADLFSPVLNFIKGSSFSSILLFCCAFMALVLANTPAHKHVEYILNQKMGFAFGDFKVYKTLIQWINDGLMSVFFFVVGLELKREFVAGELSVPRNVVMPVLSAFGGMVLPAILYIMINFDGADESIKGWGIPMATDIAFALGVLYLLGPGVPLQLKVFLTALAIIDDIGSVLVVAIFYTSNIELNNILIGFFILLIMFLMNKSGVRNVLPYAILGIGGVWLAFLMSGVHATVAAVLAAFTIPATRSIHKDDFLQNLSELRESFLKAHSSKQEKYLLSPVEQNIIGEIRRLSDRAISPLQGLEHALHGFVSYIVLPLFALANAGVAFDSESLEMVLSPVCLGTFIGLVLGKFLGIFIPVFIGIKSGLFDMPHDLNFKMFMGVALLAGMGFTMSLFINTLAFNNNTYIEQAKTGILIGSLVSGILGYFVLKYSMVSKSK